MGESNQAKNKTASILRGNLQQGPVAELLWDFVG